MRGTFIVRTALETGTPAQAEKIVDLVTPFTCEWAAHEFGTFVVQASLAFGTPVQVERLVEDTIPHAVEWSFHDNASHVAQEALTRATPEQAERIVDTAVLPRFDELVFHRCGSTVVESAFVNGTPAQQDDIVARMEADVCKFACDDYANFLFRAVYRRGTATQKERVVTAVLQNADRLSHDAGGQCIKYGTRGRRGVTAPGMSSGTILVLSSTRRRRKQYGYARSSDDVTTSSMFRTRSMAARHDRHRSGAPPHALPFSRELLL